MSIPISAESLRRSVKAAVDFGPVYNVPASPLDGISTLAVGEAVYVKTTESHSIPSYRMTISRMAEDCGMKVHINRLAHYMKVTRWK